MAMKRSSFSTHPTPILIFLKAAKMSDSRHCLAPGSRLCLWRASCRRVHGISRAKEQQVGEMASSLPGSSWKVA